MEITTFKKPIIPIPRLKESEIMALVDLGILEITEEGITTKKEAAPTDQG